MQELTNMDTIKLAAPEQGSDFKTAPYEKSSKKLGLKLLGLFLGLTIVLTIFGLSFHTSTVKVGNPKTGGLATVILADGDHADIVDSLNRLNQHELNWLIIHWDEEENISVIEGPTDQNVDDFIFNLYDDAFQLGWVVVADDNGVEGLYMIIVDPYGDDPEEHLASLELPEDLIVGLQALFSGANHNVLFVSEPSDVTRESILTDSEFLSSTQLYGRKLPTNRFMLNDEDADIVDSLNRLNQHELNWLIIHWDEEENVSVIEGPTDNNVDDFIYNLYENAFQLGWVVVADDNGVEQLYMVIVDPDGTDPEEHLASLALPEDLIVGLQALFSGANHNVLFVSEPSEVTRESILTESELLSSTQLYGRKLPTKRFMLNDDDADITDSLNRLNQHELNWLIIHWDEEENISVIEGPLDNTVDDFIYNLYDDAFQLGWVVVADDNGVESLYMVIVDPDGSDPEEHLASLELPDELIVGLQSLFSGANHNVLVVSEPSEVTRESILNESELLSSTQLYDRKLPANRFVLNDDADIIDSLNRLNQHELNWLIIHWDEEENISVIEGPTDNTVDDFIFNLYDDAVQLAWVVVPNENGVENLYMVIVNPNGEDISEYVETLELPEEILVGLEALFTGANHNILEVSSPSQVTRDSILTESEVFTFTHLSA